MLFARHSGVALTARRRGDGNRSLEVGLSDEAGFEHAAQHILLAHGGARRIDHWVVCRWRLWQARQHRGFSQAERVQRLAVVGPCGHGKAVGALAEVDLVEVDLEDLVLAQVVFDLEGEQGFVELAGKGALARQEEVFRHLHGDGRGARADAAMQGVAGGCAQDAEVVDPAVLVETFVFGCEDGALHHRRHFGDRGESAFFFAEFADLHAVGSVDAQGNLGAVFGQGFNAGKSGIGGGDRNPDQGGHHDYQQYQGNQKPAKQSGNHELCAMSLGKSGQYSGWLRAGTP